MAKISQLDMTSAIAQHTEPSALTCVHRLGPFRSWGPGAAAPDAYTTGPGLVDMNEAPGLGVRRKTPLLLCATPYAFPPSS
ncbi:unnamed protein product [Urochloa humidicola]